MEKIIKLAYKKQPDVIHSIANLVENIQVSEVDLELSQIKRLVDVIKTMKIDTTAKNYKYNDIKESISFAFTGFTYILAKYFKKHM